MKTLYVFISISLLMGFTSLGAVGDNVILATVKNYSVNQEVFWALDRGSFEKVPKYAPFDDSSVDLSKAIAMAMRQCRESNKNGRISLDSASFRQPIATKDRNGVFFYFITFLVEPEEGESFQYDVLVLPDGKTLDSQMKRIE